MENVWSSEATYGEISLTLKMPSKICSRQHFILLFFQRKQVLIFRVNHLLLGRRFTWNIKTCFIWKNKKKIFQNVVCCSCDWRLKGWLTLSMLWANSADYNIFLIFFHKIGFDISSKLFPKKRPLKFCMKWQNRIMHMVSKRRPFCMKCQILFSRKKKKKKKKISKSSAENFSQH